MSRQKDPEVAHLVRRAALLRQLTASAAIGEPDAEHWIAQWEREAEVIGIERFSSGYWNLAEEWIANHRAARSLAPTPERQDGLKERIEQGEARLAAGERIERERRRRPRPE